MKQTSQSSSKLNKTDISKKRKVQTKTKTNYRGDNDRDIKDDDKPMDNQDNKLSYTQYFLDQKNFNIKDNEDKRIITHLRVGQENNGRLSIPTISIPLLYNFISVDFEQKNPQCIKECITPIFKLFIEFTIKIDLAKLDYSPNEILIASLDNINQVISNYTTIIDSVVRSYFPNLSDSETERSDDDNECEDGELIKTSTNHPIEGYIFKKKDKSQTGTRYYARSVYTPLVNTNMALQIREHIIQKIKGKYPTIKEDDLRSMFYLEPYRNGIILPLCTSYIPCEKCRKLVAEEQKCRITVRDDYRDHIKECIECVKKMVIREECDQCTFDQECYTLHSHFDGDGKEYDMYALSKIVKKAESVVYGSIACLDSDETPISTDSRYVISDDAPFVREKDVKLLEIVKKQTNNLVTNTKEELAVATYLHKQIPEEYGEQFEVGFIKDDIIILNRVEDGYCIFCEKMHESCGCFIRCNYLGKFEFRCERDKFYNKLGSKPLPLLKIKNMNKTMFSIDTPMYMLKYLWLFNKLEEGHIGRSEVLHMALDNNMIIASDGSKSTRLLWNDETKNWDKKSISMLLIQARDLLEKRIFNPMSMFIDDKSKQFDKLKVNKSRDDDKNDIPNKNKNNKKIKSGNKNTEEDEEKNPYDNMITKLANIESEIFKRVSNITDIITPMDGIEGAENSLLYDEMDINPILFTLGDGKVADFNLVPELGESYKLNPQCNNIIFEYLTLTKSECNNQKITSIISDYSNYTTSTKHAENAIFNFFNNNQITALDEVTKAIAYNQINVNNLPALLKELEIDVKDFIRYRRKDDWISFKNNIKFNANADEQAWDNILNTMFLILPHDWRLPEEDRKGLTQDEINDLEILGRQLSDQGRTKKMFMQMLFGYCLTGYTNLEKAFVWYNFLGRGGKGLLAEAQKTIMGDYYCPLPASYFYADVVGKQNPNSPAPYEVAMSKRRLGAIDETDPEADLDPSFKSKASGSEKLGRDIHEKLRKIYNRGKIIFHLNKIFTTKKWDYSTWRRICLTIFPCHFSEKKVLVDKIRHRRIDMNLKDRIKDNESLKQSILNWALIGAAKYFRNGKHIPIPKCMEDALNRYENMADSYSRWKKACIEEIEDEKEQASTILKSYDSFCNMIKNKIEEAKRDVTEAPAGLTNLLKQKEFYQRLALDFKKGKYSNYHYHGLKLLKTPLEEEPFDL